MDVQFKLEMQRAIQKGLSFFEFWREQDTYSQMALYTKDLAQIEYANQADNLKGIKRKSSQHLIVTDRNGWPSEKWEFILHASTDAASKHGIKTLGKGEFKIVPFTKFRSTPVYKILSRRIETRNRWHQYKKTLK